MIPIKIDSAWKGTSDCRNCGIRDMVLFADLNEQDFGEIHTPIDDMVFAAEAPLYTEGETAVGVFTLRKGMVKLVRATADGRERIVRVLRPGDTSVPTLGRGFVEQGAGRFQAHPAVCPAGLILVWFQTYSGLALAEFRTKNDPIPNAF